MTTTSPQPQRARRITGRCLPSDGFRLLEDAGAPNPDHVLQVLRGELAAYRVVGYVPVKACRKIASNFWESTRRTPRYGEGDDGVEGYFVGASHIDKTIDEYLDQAAEYELAVRGLYHGTRNPVADLRQLLVLARRGQVAGARPASYRGRTAGDSKAVCWNQAGEYQLMPHDDLAQLRDPLQAGFEIQQLTRVMAVNVYPEVPPGGGQLKLWNVEPDDKTRATLGLTYSGFPYPPELLDEHASLIVPVASGDLCVINGNLIHAVLGDERSSAASKRRLLLTCFTSLTPHHELLWWT